MRKRIVSLIGPAAAALAFAAGCATPHEPQTVPRAALGNDDYYLAAAQRTETLLREIETRFGDGDHRLIVPLMTLSMSYFRLNRIDESDKLLERAWILLDKHPEIEPGEIHVPLRYGSITLATRAGDMLDVKGHLAAGTDVNQRDTRGMTPLHHAAAIGNPEMAAMLLRAGAIAAARDWEGRTVRQFAAQAGHDRILELLDRTASVREEEAPGTGEEQPAMDEDFPDAYRQDDIYAPPDEVFDDFVL